jgi:hypothetical protein
MSARKLTIPEKIIQEFTHTELIKEFNATWEIIPHEHIVRRKPHTKAHTNYEKIKGEW